jgi:hypothetical protein
LAEFGVCGSFTPVRGPAVARPGSQLLGGDGGRVELVAVDVNPLYNELAYTQAFDRQEGLAGAPTGCT